MKKNNLTPPLSKRRGRTNSLHFLLFFGSWDSSPLEVSVPRERGRFVEDPLTKGK